MKRTLEMHAALSGSVRWRRRLTKFFMAQINEVLVKYHGGCHCGAICFSFESHEVTNGLRCNCSLCSKRGAVMSPDPVPAENVEIEAEEGALGLYQFGAKTAKHYFCKRCGIYPFHEPASRPGHFRFNLWCIDGIDPLLLEVIVFDGKQLP